MRPIVTGWSSVVCLSVSLSLGRCGLLLQGGVAWSVSLSLGRCGLLLQGGVAWSVCLSVCH